MPPMPLAISSRTLPATRDKMLEFNLHSTCVLRGSQQ
jgi:hypothetical protein